MFQDLFDQMGPWTWIIIGLLLLVLEIFVSLPGSLFLFTGIAALIVGASALLFDWAWQFQLFGFAALSVVLVLFGRRYFANQADRTGDQGLNERGKRLVGSSYILTEPIVNGSGRVRIGDSNWGVTGADTPSGARVKVVSVDGSTLRVELE
jgi:membrane protein implicated in regulation of membrane protease activity